MKAAIKKQVNSLLGTYNLSHTVNFATRVQNSSSTAMDNIFIDSASKIKLFWYFSYSQWPL
jgi:hypothetical protein